GSSSGFDRSVAPVDRVFRGGVVHARVAEGRTITERGPGSRGEARRSTDRGRHVGDRRCRSRRCARQGEGGGGGERDGVAAVIRIDVARRGTGAGRPVTEGPRVGEGGAL